jgi:hypothetical protein
MKFIARPPRRAMGTAVAVVAAAGLIAGATALKSSHVLGAPHGTSHASAHLAAAQDTLVTDDMGPIAPNSVTLQQGPGGYPVAGYAQALTPYTVSCFSTPEVAAGQYGPYTITDMSTVWYDLTDPNTGQDSGWIQATNPANQFSVDASAVPGSVGRCASDPAPPVPPVSDNGTAIGAAGPISCASGPPLTEGTSTITVHSTSGHLDVEFDAAIGAMSVDVKDLSTGQDGSGWALADQKATWHFIEDGQTTFGDHTLQITVDAALGGPIADPENPAENLGNPVAPAEGDYMVSDVSWENLSDNCVPRT